MEINVGTIYEHKKNKSVKRVIAVNQEKNTVTLENAAGETNDVSLKAFGLSWKEAEVQEMPEVAEFEEAKPKRQKKEKAPKEPKEPSHLYEDLTAYFLPNVAQPVADESGCDVSIVTLMTKRGVALKIGNRRVLETYAKVRDDRLAFFLHEDLYKMAAEALAGQEMNFNEDFILKYFFYTPKTVPMADAFALLMPSLKQMAKDYVAHKAEAEKAAAEKAEEKAEEKARKDAEKAEKAAKKAAKKAAREANEADDEDDEITTDNQ